MGLMRSPQPAGLPQVVEVLASIHRIKLSSTKIFIIDFLLARPTTSENDMSLLDAIR